MVFLALDWFIWAALALLFLYALLRRLFRSWQARRRMSKAQGSKRP